MDRPGRLRTAARAASRGDYRARSPGPRLVPGKLWCALGFASGLDPRGAGMRCLPNAAFGENQPACSAGPRLVSFCPRSTREDLANATALGNGHDDHIRGSALNPGTVDRLDNVVVGHPGQDCFIQECRHGVE